MIGTIPLDGKPEFSVSDGKGKVFVNIEDKSVINVINSSTLKVEQHWPIAPGEEPSGLALETVPTQAGAKTIAIDKTTHHLYLTTAEYETAPTAANRRPPVKPNSFVILDIETLK